MLGRFQDTEVQRQALRGFAEEMMADGTPTEAVLAMGELIGHLDAEQDRARASSTPAFARFARPASIQRLRTLGASRGEGHRDLQHQGRRREDVDRGQPGLPRGARGAAHAAVGPRPAGRGHVPVPGAAAGEGRRPRPGHAEAARSRRR